MEKMWEKSAVGAHLDGEELLHVAQAHVELLVEAQARAREVEGEEDEQQRRKGDDDADEDAEALATVLALQVRQRAGDVLGNARGGLVVELARAGLRVDDDEHCTGRERCEASGGRSQAARRRGRAPEATAQMPQMCQAQIKRSVFTEKSGTTSTSGGVHRKPRSRCTAPPLPPLPRLAICATLGARLSSSGRMARPLPALPSAGAFTAAVLDASVPLERPLADSTPRRAAALLVSSWGCMMRTRSTSPWSPHSPPLSPPSPSAALAAALSAALVGVAGGEVVAAAAGLEKWLQQQQMSGRYVAGSRLTSSRPRTCTRRPRASHLAAQYAHSAQSLVRYDFGHPPTMRRRMQCQARTAGARQATGHRCRSFDQKSTQSAQRCS